MPRSRRPKQAQPGRPPKAPAKRFVRPSVTLDPDLVSRVKAEAKCLSKAIDEALRLWLETTPEDRT